MKVRYVCTDVGPIGEDCKKAFVLAIDCHA